MLITLFKTNIINMVNIPLVMLIKAYKINY